MSQRILNSKGVVVADYSDAALKRRARALISMGQTIARLSDYDFDGGSWTDDQAEDAFGALSGLIRTARALFPDIVPAPDIKGTND